MNVRVYMNVCRGLLKPIYSNCPINQLMVKYSSRVSLFESAALSTQLESRVKGAHIISVHAR
jgi:hypothetical protein